ncbi:MAG: hypothetical protein M3328_11850, partial [Chloroflexota bacterium]|nr:hypothetical protein [Chloroflexota bacterium]
VAGIVARAGGYSLLLKDHLGNEWKATVSTGAVSYSEGDVTQQVSPASGDYVRVEGSTRGGTTNATSLRLLSVSRTGARLSYSPERDGHRLRVSGTNWPPSQNVTFSLRPFAGGGVQVGTARSDSRGNLAASWELPSALTADQPIWLFVQVVEQNSLLAQVALLYSSSSESGANEPPALVLLGRSGEQMGGLGAYCHGGRCVEAVGVPVPGGALPVAVGEVLGLHSGADAEMGTLPQQFTARLYAHPPEPAGEGATLGGTYYFSPKSLPVFSTGEVPGRPFSVSLPGAVPPGKYLLLVSVLWSDASDAAGGREEGVYAFALEVPADPVPGLTE